MTEVSPPAPARRSSTLRRFLPGQSDDPFVRAVARLPVRVRTKLLLAFLGGAALLVVIALLGLRVLGQSNERAESLGALQVRVAGYERLGAHAQGVRQLLALCAGGKDWGYWLNGGKPSQGPPASCLRSIEQPVAAELALLGAATSPSFVPAPSEAPPLRRIQSNYRKLQAIVGRITASHHLSLPDHLRAENLAVALNIDAQSLADGTTETAASLVAENRSSYSSSRDLFIGVAAGAVVLALLAGLFLSWALVEPIRKIGERLSGVARGDFSRHVEVANRDELGELAANVNRMNDELLRLYGELEAASRHKSEFLANMSHELRTPLNAILGFSQVLQQQLFGEVNEKQAEYLQDILSSGEHLLALINDVLDLAKVEAGQVELELAAFSLSESLQRGLVMVREKAATNGVELATHFDPSIEVVEGDERRIRQVVFNLLSNAVKFTPSGGRVDVSTARENGAIRVAVTDTGPGIAPDDQALIFEEFRQARSGDGERPEGTGLGLALSRRLVELHGGRLWVESDPGKGSTFAFTLPVGSP